MGIQTAQGVQFKTNVPVRGRKSELEAEEWLVAKGMKRLEPFPLEDRQKVAKAMRAAWLEQCKSLGEEALKNCNRINDALK